MNDNDELLRAAQQVVKAISDPGVNPAYHHQQVNNLSINWPTMYRAVNNLVTVLARRKSPEGVASKPEPCDDCPCQAVQAELDDARELLQAIQVQGPYQVGHDLGQLSATKIVHRARRERDAARADVERLVAERDAARAEVERLTEAPWYYG